MQYEDDQVLPVLIPIQRKKKLDHGTPTNNNIPHTPNQSNQAMNIFKKQKAQHQSQNTKDNQNKAKQNKDQLTPYKLDELAKKFEDKTAVPTKQEKLSNAAKRTDQNQKTRYLIAEMLNKISVKNISEELYPVSSEHIRNQIADIEKEIKQLYAEAEKKEESILKNQNNQHLKKQLSNIKRSIDHCTLIKELYYQKVNLRNKISILEKNILELKEQKREIEIEAIRRDQSAKAHANNQPCQKQRQLQQKLNKRTHQLQQQTKMRKKLEQNVTQIINNFKKLYNDADAARSIVTEKLRTIQQREKALSQFSSSSHGSEQSIKGAMAGDSSQIQSIGKNQRKRQDKEAKHQEGDSNNQMSSDRRQYENTRRRKPKKVDKQLTKPKPEDKRATLQEQIQKMRGNQSIIVNSIRRS